MQHVVALSITTPIIIEADIEGFRCIAVFISTSYTLMLVDFPCFMFILWRLTEHRLKTDCLFWWDLGIQKPQSEGATDKKYVCKTNIPFTRSSKHRAIIQQTSSKCIQNTRARRVV